MIVSFDLETTGLNPDTCQVLEVGAVAYDPEKDDVLGEFHQIVKHNVVRGEPYALAMNSDLLRQMADKYHLDYNGELATLALFKGWLGAMRLKAGAEGKPHALGFNVGAFDLQWKLDGQKLKSLFHHRCVEMGSYLAGFHDVDFPESSKDAFRNILARDVPHSALEDAKGALEIYRMIRKDD